MRIIARLNVGGPAIHVTLLTERLRPPEFESTLVAGRVGANEGDMSYLASQRGVTPIIVGDLGRELSPLRDLRTLVELVRLMRRERPDVVHTHTAKAGFVGRMAAWIARVPVRVHTFHGHVLEGYFSPAKSRMFLSLERASARISTRLITISPALERELVERFRIAGHDRFSVIPLGLDLARFAEGHETRGSFRTSLGIPASAPLVGIVGRLVPIKNHELFLQMALLVLEQRNHAHFAVVGDGELRAALETRVAELGLGSAVHFAGWHDDLVPIYTDLDVLVISSDSEGTPVSVIEALASGTAVVSTAVGGVPDVLDGGRIGGLAPRGDAEKLAACTIAALERTDDSQRAATAAATIAAYGIDRLVDDLSELYRTLLAERGTIRRRDSPST